MTSMHEDAADGPTLRFRSYTPRDEQLQALCIALPQPADADALLKKFYELDPDESEDENVSAVVCGAARRLRRALAASLGCVAMQSQLVARWRAGRCNARARSRESAYRVVAARAAPISACADARTGREPRATARQPASQASGRAACV